MVGVITSYFGNRVNPVNKNAEFHNGIDIGADKNSPIYAVKDGIVLESGESRLNGKYIKYKTYDNYIITYAHLNKSLVKAGQEIKQGEKVALIGSTGQSTGYHLHYSIQKDGEYINPIHMLTGDDIGKEI